MKITFSHFVQTLAIFLLGTLLGCTAPHSPFSPDMERPNPYTPPPKIAFLLPAEQIMLEQINLARTKPQVYAQRYIKPLMGDGVCDDGQYGVDIKKAYDEMMAQKPLHPLVPLLGLTLMMRDKISDPERNVHGSRIKFLGYDYAKWVRLEGAHIQENAVPGPLHKITDFDPKSPVYANDIRFVGCGESPVNAWMIDRSNGPNYGHRKNIMDPNAYFAGIALGVGAADSKIAAYRDAPAIYLVLTGSAWRDKSAAQDRNGNNHYKDGKPLHRYSVSVQTSWPVQRMTGNNELKLVNR
ncbi:MAG: hypothetical protein AAF975_08120 [Spirochaetota bacterium]